MEMMIATAYAEQKKATENNDTLCDAFVAFVSEILMHDTDDTMEVSLLKGAWDDHERDFLGEWDNFVEFVMDYADNHFAIDSGVMDYINWEDMANDWEMSYNIARTDDGTVYVWSA